MASKFFINLLRRLGINPQLFITSLSLVLLNCNSDASKSSVGKKSIDTAAQERKLARTTSQYRYGNLSLKHDYLLQLHRNFSDSDVTASSWTLLVYDKISQRLVDSFTQQNFVYTSGFLEWDKTRSFVTGAGTKTEVTDNDYGPFVIADLNFDNHEDLALANDAGAASDGPFYSFYLWEDGKYRLNHFLTDSMRYFPSERIAGSKLLKTYVHAGVCGLGEHVYLLNPSTRAWRQVSHRIINICKD